MDIIKQANKIKQKQQEECMANELCNVAIFVVGPWLC